ncbi:mitogen-activated protein kinase 13 [Reticulomyxa filosa]|uniref:Mitogen-activated protein kinase 13 n=1 Tax=Reticulomyxa filosa TaxID=46433 RepID=X6LWT5_RETFI|nr:mitogen-activated protein kinase 13 [Reticulomyxa filosa]|eukprot:ETO05821.1 mitogen-activated protein kinase 13 [Reticulomyxa filosa]
MVTLNIFAFFFPFFFAYLWHQTNLQKCKSISCSKYQLHITVIFDVIGTPTREAIAKIADEKAQRHLLNLPYKPRTDFSQKFPGTSPEGIDLLNGLLEFDFEKRLTVDEALAHPFLKRVRDLEAEVSNQNEPHKLKKKT